MTADVISKDECVKMDFPDEGNEFYETAAKYITSLSVPNHIKIESGNGTVEYNSVFRSGTIFVTEAFNSMNLTCGNYDPKYLVMVNPEKNNYKFYKLAQNGSDVVATYGRIGAQKGELFGERDCIYPLSMFWIKYYEKISKGYEDKSDIYLTPVKKKEKAVKEEKVEKDVANSLESELYRKLKSFARHLVNETCISGIVTEGMVSESRRLLNKLYKTKTVKTFNATLLELLAVCPRRVDKVAYLIAKGTGDFANIVSREENLVNAMEVLTGEKADKIEDGGFGNIRIYEANDSQKKEVLEHLSKNLQPMVKHIYRVIDEDQKKRFDDYCKKYKITTIKQFWHGSRNENWLSIVLNRLKLHPNAVITGKMFGNGIYFAPNSMKSWGYTSHSGARWTNGSSSTGFMGLYATAYGTPKDVTSSMSYTEKSIAPNNCVHAHAGQYLMNDEIVFYNESAMVLNYLVEFAD